MMPWSIVVGVGTTMMSGEVWQVSLRGHSKWVAPFHPINYRMIPDVQESIYYTPETVYVFKIYFFKKEKKTTSQNHHHSLVLTNAS